MDQAADLPEKIHLPRTDESDSLKRIRHTFSHVMAMAVQTLFPKAQVTIGPSIDYGFYYDLIAPTPLPIRISRRSKSR